MEEKVVTEQPEDAATEKVIEVESSADTGSELGKFKDEKALLEAYNNLQSEFTRKCQKLAELEKSDNTNSESANNADSVMGEEEKVPLYEQKNWDEKVTDFLIKNQKAKEYSVEISEEILKDESLKNNPDALEIAWGRVVQRNFKSPADLVHEEGFVENYVFSSDEVKRKVLEIYLRELSGEKAPKVLSSSKRSGINMSVFNEPKDLTGAKVLLEKMFKG